MWLVEMKKIKVLRGKKEIELELDEEESTKAKKVYKGRYKRKKIKHIELDMQPKNKEAK